MSGRWVHLGPFSHYEPEPPDQTTSTADSIEIREIKAEPFYEVTIADLEVLRNLARYEHPFRDSPDHCRQCGRKAALDAEIARRKALRES